MRRRGGKAWLAALALAVLPACGTGDRGREAGAGGGAAQPPASPALAETRAPGSPWVLQVRSVARSGPEVLEFTLALAAARSPGGGAPGPGAPSGPAVSLEEAVAGSYLADGAGGKRFYVLRGANGASRCLPSPPGAPLPCQRVTARFPAPRAEPGTATLVVPGFPPFRLAYPGTTVPGPS